MLSKEEAFDRIATLVRSDEEDIAHQISDIVDQVIGPEKPAEDPNEWAIKRLQENGLIGVPPRPKET